MAKKLWITALCVTLAGSVLVTAAGRKSTQITGTISAINDATQQIIVNGVTVQATDDTVITITTRKVQVPIAFDDLDIGMTVRVCGKVIDGVLVADKINVMYGGK
ncbi:MAG: DUF5666 domain-containing protein [Phycisphaerales bacterium]